MNSIATSAQPNPVSPSRALRVMGALLFSLLLMPACGFAEEPTAATGTPPAASTAADTPAAAPSAGTTTPAAPAADAGAAVNPNAAAVDPNAPTDEELLAEEQGLVHDLSPWGMYQNADIVVKSVMIGLVLASILTWTVWVAKSIELIGARRRLQRELLDLKSARNLNQAAEQARTKHSFSTLLIEDARDELKLSTGCREKEGIKERVSFRLERLVAACGREMSKGTGVLATIGSTAPFVGLFGTVWGIMNSFIGIAKSQTTNLAVVAPGIAEALLATALGLVAAIPAVIIYNVFARSIASYKAQVADASAQVLLLVSRDLDHQSSGERSQQPHMVKAV